MTSNSPLMKTKRCKGALGGKNRGAFKPLMSSERRLKRLRRER